MHGDNHFDIDIELLKTEMAEMPGHMADICSRVAAARNDEARLEKRFKLIRYQVEKNLRDMYKIPAMHERKPTEDAIKMEVALNSMVRSAQEEHTTSEELLRLLEAELQAYVCKRDMLVSLSAYVRTENETLRLSNSR